MAKLSELLQLCALVGSVVGQVGPWTHRLQWENNGHVYSLLSTGSEYHSPVHSRRESRVYLSSRSQVPFHITPGARLHPNLIGPAAILGSDSRHYIFANNRATGTGHARMVAPARQRPAGAPGTQRHNLESASNQTNQRALPEFSGRSIFTTDEDNSVNQASGSTSTSQEQQPYNPPVHLESPQSVNTQELAPFPTEEHPTSENMIGDDPRNPMKNHRNNIFYNVYPPGRSTNSRTRRPPGTGYGTRYFHNGNGNAWDFWISFLLLLLLFTHNYVHARSYLIHVHHVYLQVCQIWFQIRTPYKSVLTSSVSRCTRSGAPLKRTAWPGKSCQIHIYNQILTSTHTVIQNDLPKCKTSPDATFLNNMSTM